MYYMYVNVTVQVFIYVIVFICQCKRSISGVMKGIQPALSYVMISEFCAAPTILSTIWLLTWNTRVVKK